jgi:hypothetical protein
MRILLAVAIAVGALGACGKGDYKKCDAACRNFFVIAFWEEQKGIPVPAGMTPEAHKAQQVIELERRLEAGIDFCISKCQSANNDDQSDCLIAASTWETVKACSAEDERASR